jgi:hypothetical protein
LQNELFEYNSKIPKHFGIKAKSVKLIGSMNDKRNSKSKNKSFIKIPEKFIAGENLIYRTWN